MCKVLADSVDELIRWGREHGIWRIHVSRSGKPHFDLWGGYLELCPRSGEMRRHREMYRANVMKKGSADKLEF